MKLPDDLPILEFPDAETFGSWLAENHASAPGLWLKLHKKGSGLGGLTYVLALDEALRFGWIDSQKVGFDAHSSVQRFTPRRKRSRWSKVNRVKIEALVAAGRMEPAGLAEVERAKEDGRWEAAYDPPSTATTPPDFEAALDAEAGARAFYDKLSASQRFLMIYGIQEAKQAATRERRIAKFVGMCGRGEKPG